MLYGSLYSKARNIQQKKQNALLVLQDASNQEKLLTIRFQGLQDSRSALQNTTIDHIVECRKILCSLPVHRLPLPSVDVLAKAVVCEHIEQAKPEAVSAQDVDKIFELLDLQS